MKTKAVVFLCWVAGIAVIAQELTGIGVALRKSGTDCVVQGILPDSPAASTKAVRIGDRIVAIAQGTNRPVDAEGLPLEQAVQLIRGPKGTEVRLTLLGPGQDEREARVVRIVRGALKGVQVAGEVDPLLFGLMQLAFAISQIH